MGVNYIDTARAYQDSENKIGAAIKGYRDRLFIATKTGNVPKSQRRQILTKVFAD